MKGFKKYFNSHTLNGRANVAKATYASIAIMYIVYRVRKRSKNKAIASPPSVSTSKEQPSIIAPSWSKCPPPGSSNYGNNLGMPNASSGGMQDNQSGYVDQSKGSVNCPTLAKCPQIKEDIKPIVPSAESENKQKSGDKFQPNDKPKSDEQPNTIKDFIGVPNKSKEFHAEGIRKHCHTKTAKDDSVHVDGTDPEALARSRATKSCP